MEENGGAGGRRSLPPDLQVFIGIGGLFALLALAVAVAVVLIFGLRNDATRLTDHELAYATAIESAALYAKAMANDERGLLLSGDAQFAEQLRGRTDQARIAFATATKEATGVGQLRAVGEAQAGFERWLRALNDEIATFQAGNREAAVAASLGETRTLRKQYEASLAEARGLGVSAIRSAKDSVSNASSRSITILLVYLGLALVIGFGLTLWIVRTVLRPVYAVLAAAGQSDQAQSRV